MLTLSKSHYRPIIWQLITITTNYTREKYLSTSTYVSEDKYMSVWSKNKQLLVFFPSVNHDLLQLQKLSTLILWLSVDASLCRSNSSLSEGIFDIQFSMLEKIFLTFPSAATMRWLKTLLFSFVKLHKTERRTIGGVIMISLSGQVGVAGPGWTQTEPSSLSSVRTISCCVLR